MTPQELAEVRLRLGLRQNAFARLMGMTPQSYNRLERGEREPTAQQAAFVRYIEAPPPSAKEVSTISEK